MSKTEFIAEPGKQEIIVRRVFNAPRDLVFKTYLDPKLRSEWWGPRNLTTNVEMIETRPGGRWRIVQRDTQGNEFAFHGVYHDVVPPERIIETFEWEGMPGHVNFNTSTLEEVGGKTTVTNRIVFQSVEDRDGMLGSGMHQGMEEGFDRFDELLERLQKRMAA